MNNADHRDREIAALRERLSRLCGAGVRINESLELDAALQEVVDSARDLTDSRYGAIAVLREAGGPPHLIVSGLTEEQVQGLWDIPGGEDFFEYIRGLQEPLRIPGIEAVLGASNVPGLQPVPRVTSLLVVPVRHQGTGVGTIFMGHGEDGREFTREDEETLVLFASQAAMAVSSSRRYGDERRAREYVETLLNTSPVGVVVLDAIQGVPVSFNREAARIVDGLRDPDQSPEQLLDVIACVRADGREFSLLELPMADVLNIGETVRAEEIILRVPDGRSVTTLVNATPIRTAGGQLESFVVTLQDMTPLEELEKLRAEFLEMVSHELRTPLATIKGSTTTLLNSPSDIEPAVVTQFHRIMDQQVDHMQRLIGNLLDVAHVETGTLSVSPAPVDVEDLVDEARRGFAGQGSTDRLRVDLAPDLPPVLADRRRIIQVLGNLLSNADRYSPEGSPIQVTAVSDGVLVAVSVSDHGRGIPSDVLPNLFRKFPRSVGTDRAAGTAGSGLGLAIVKGIVETHGGRVWADSPGPGLGATFTFTLPAAEGDPGSGAVPAGTSSVRSRRPPQEKLRILAVDDDPQALWQVRDAISRAGYAPIVTGDPADVRRLMEEERPDLVLLDLMLPNTDGIELMQEILSWADVPVVFVSAYGQEQIVARALDRGASDYVVKPFSATELAARIRAALRRRETPYGAEPSQPFEVGELAIHYPQRLVRVAGHPVALTPTEYRVLQELSVHAGRTLSHAHLLQRIWGPERKDEPWLVREVVKRLRRKLGDDARDPRYIITEPRVGYRMGGSEDPR